MGVLSAAPFIDTSHVHASWLPLLEVALNTLPRDYLDELARDNAWLPGPQKIFDAFSLPRNTLTAILVGESPYPRAQSANGYAFWDAAVHTLWSATGLATAVNRATSLRNFIKMLLVASGRLSPDNTSQAAIAALDKTSMIQTLDALFLRLQAQGVLLLNASLVFRAEQVKQDAAAWQPFMASLLVQLENNGKTPELWLFGRIAEQIQKLNVAAPYQKIIAEHPYNLSFVQNQGIMALFRPRKLLENMCDTG